MRQMMGVNVFADDPIERIKGTWNTTALLQHSSTRTVLVQYQRAAPARPQWTSALSVCADVLLCCCANVSPQQHCVTSVTTSLHCYGVGLTGTAREYQEWVFTEGNESNRDRDPPPPPPHISQECQECARGR